LDDFVLTDATRPLLDLADIIKLDMLEQPPTRKQVEHYLARGWRHETARKTKNPPLWWACCR